MTAPALSASEAYAGIWHRLFLKRIVHEGAVLNERTLPRVVMPNCDGIDPDPRPDLKPGR